MRFRSVLGIFGFVFLSGPSASHGAHPTDSFGPELTHTKVAGIGPCQAVELVGDRLYATGRGRFHVLDVSNPARPRRVGGIDGLGSNTRQIFVRGTIAYVTARQDGLWLIDVVDSTKPRIIGHYDTVEMATGISVSGSVAFVATRQYGVELVDVSDPRAPRHLSMLKTGEAQSCWGRDGYLYIGDWAPKKLVVADVRNPRHPVIVGEAPLDGYGDGGCLRGSICFAATGHHSRTKNREDGHGKGHGLEIFDVSDPRKPAFISRVKFPPSYQISNDMWTARVAGDHCVVADTWNGLFVVNIGDLTKPAIVAHAVLPKRPRGDVPDPVGGIALGKGVIYAAGIYTGLYVLAAPDLGPVVREPDQAPSVPAPDPAETREAGFLSHRPAGQVRSVTVVGDLAWTACGEAGIQAIRLGDRLKPVSVTPGKGEVFHLAVSGDRLYAAENAAGLAIYRIEPSLKLTELGRLRVPGRNVKQVSCPGPGRFALFHGGGAEVQIADVRDPAKPSVVLRDSQVGLFYGDQLVPELMGDRYLVAYWHRSGPGWYDVSGDQPVILGNSPDERLYSFTDGACALGGQLLIVKHGKLQLLNPGDMRDVSRLPAVAVPGRYLRGRPSTDGRLLAIARRPDRQVSLFDISNLEKPRPLRDFQLRGHPGACRFWNGRLVIPAGYEGLLVEEKAAASRP